MKTFEIGKTYQARSACDHDCIFSFEIVRRTAKTITFLHHGKETTRGVKVTTYDPDTEICRPLGSYSMAPVIYANREAV